MPHSLASDSKNPSGAVKDEPMEDSGIPSEVNQAPEGDRDDDVEMDEAQVPEPEPEPESAPEAVKKEVKLEELFADVESDDEFPSSAPIDTPQSSSPEAPASPT